jgi:Bacterial Ig-like domain/Laminin G domain
MRACRALGFGVGASGSTGDQVNVSHSFAAVFAAAVALGCVGVQPLAAAAAEGGFDARWEMNELPGATTMSDSSGNGVDGTVGSAVRTGYQFDGATGYQWTKTNPNEAPAKPERLVQVDSDRLNPGYRDFSITLRFRTTHSAGNLLQKGQSTNKGGYFKFQNVRGQITCLVRGYDEQGNMLSKAVNTGVTPLDDGKWHTLTCARTADRVTLRVDGSSKVRTALGPTGSISNDVPLTLAGKPNCDQVTVTCDYFSGEMDYLHFHIEGGTDVGGGGGDTTAPTVTSSSPAADATGVARGVSPTATFSEPVTGVDGATMTLRRGTATGPLVESVVTYDATTRRAVLNPNTRLAPNTRYVAALGPGVADLAGHPLAPVSWAFTTSP